MRGSWIYMILYILILNGSTLKILVLLCLGLFIVFSRHNHTNSWSSSGCKVTFASSAVTSCLCNHTTNFAVLMNYLESTVNYFVLMDPSIHPWIFKAKLFDVKSTFRF